MDLLDVGVSDRWMGRVQAPGVCEYLPLTLGRIEVDLEVQVLEGRRQASWTCNHQRHPGLDDDALQIEHRRYCRGLIHRRKAGLHLVVDLTQPLGVVLERPDDRLRVDQVPAEQHEKHRSQRDGPLDLQHVTQNSMPITLLGRRREPVQAHVGMQHWR